MRGKVDLVLKDKNGKVISDTKVDRIKKMKDLGFNAMNTMKTDSFAGVIFRSYNSAVNDPANEFIHLYEIRDAIRKKFGSKLKACKALKISETDWDKFGKLANDEPLKQGRHRGKYENIREATSEEKNTARKLAREFIEKYITYMAQ